MNARHAAVLLRRGLACAALLLGLQPSGRAGDTSLIYTLNDRGNLSIGGTLLEKLPSTFDPTVTPAQNTQQQWVDLVVEGSDRWALRLDGRVHQNGKKLFVLPFDPAEGSTSWLRLAHADELYSLRADGTLAVGDDASTRYNNFSFLFVDLVTPAIPLFTGGPAALALRSDGAIFGGDELTPGMLLVGGDGVIGSKDGEFIDTFWVGLAIDPTTDEVLGLRADGKIHRFAPADFDASSGIDPGDDSGGPPLPLGGGEGDPPAGPPVGTLEAALPGPLNPVTGDRLYVQLDVDADGTWYALRQDGAVFRSDDLAAPLVDFPGDGLDPEKTFVDLRVRNGSFVALRFDGLLFQDTSTDPTIDLDKKRYRRLALSGDAPDLSSFKNRPPVAATYKTVRLENEAAVIPVLLSDVDKASAELEVTVDLSGLPGATWDPEARTVNFPGALAGSYRFTVSASDGLIAQPKTFKYTVKVLAADLDPLKNLPPSPSRVKKVQALVGHPLVVPLLTTDRDGDALTLSVDPAAGAFGRGAVFDAQAGTVSWTPTFADIGKWPAVVSVSDGVKTVKLKLSFQVINPLIF